MNQLVGKKKGDRFFCHNEPFSQAALCHKALGCVRHELAWLHVTDFSTQIVCLHVERLCRDKDFRKRFVRE
jgi:hypothetical protein